MKGISKYWRLLFKRYPQRTRKPESLDKFPSQIFRDVVARGTGSPVVTCGCGITYFADPDGAFYDEGEFEGLEKKALDDPGKYRQMDWDSISWGSLGGIDFVWECEECELAAKYEKFIWYNRRRIIEYIKAKVLEIQNSGEEEGKIIEDL